MTSRRTTSPPAFVHHETVSAARAPEGSDTEGRWDVLAEEDGYFRVFDPRAGLYVYETHSLHAAMTEAKRLSTAYDQRGPQAPAFRPG